MLETALKTGGYEYYHFLTGVDLPLKPQSEIHRFFEQNNGKQFIYIEEGVPKSAQDRVKYYYPFQENFDRNNKVGNGIRKIGVVTQSLLGINRVEHNIMLGIGSAYFDLTADFVAYVIEQKDRIRKMFSKGFCVDEMFIQTLYLNSPFNTEKGRYIYSGEDTWIAKEYMNISRAIDWKRGRPYTYQDDDFDDLMSSGCNFARKFDMEANPALFYRIVNEVTNIEGK